MGGKFISVLGPLSAFISVGLEHWWVQRMWGLQRRGREAGLSLPAPPSLIHPPVFVQCGQPCRHPSWHFYWCAPHPGVLICMVDSGGCTRRLRVTALSTIHPRPPPATQASRV